MWQYMPVTPEFGKSKWEDQEFKASLQYETLSQKYVFFFNFYVISTSEKNYKNSPETSYAFLWKGEL